MTDTIPDLVDHILDRAECRLSVEELGDFVFGGLRAARASSEFLADVVRAGVALRRHQGLPTAVSLPEEIGTFLLSWACEHLAEEMLDDDPRIAEISRRLEAIERRYKVHGRLVPWKKGRAPADWIAANGEWDAISNEHFVRILTPEAPDLARQFVADILAFDTRRERGRQNFARLVGRDDIAIPIQEMAKQFK